jgi:murein DD-endopeptidase MepM/ murein hydrolase activator NlpD
MSQNLTKILGIVITFAILSSNLSIESAKNSLLESSGETTQTSQFSEQQSFSSSQKKKMPKTKVIKNEIGESEIDTESDITISKQEEKVYKKCKLEVTKKRSKRNKNKPTPCFKKPQKVTEELTDQDYTILIDSLIEKKEQDEGKDMNKELPISDFTIVKYEDCKNQTLSLISSSSNTSFSTSLVSIDTTQLDSNISSMSTTLNSSQVSTQNLASSSSQNSCDNSSSSSSSSTNLFSSSSQISYSSVNSDSSLSSSPYQSSLISSSVPGNVNLTSVSSSLSSSQSSAISSSLVGSSVNSETSSQVSNTPISSDTLSILDFFFNFGLIKGQALDGNKVDGYRLPFESGVKVTTQRVMNDIATHANHNALDFVSVKNDNIQITENKNVVASKSGKVVIAQEVYGDYFTNNTLGKHIIIKQDDGNYTIYAHLSSISKSLNENVRRGEKIGVQGQTGTYVPNMDNSHVHFESFKSGILDDPICTTNSNLNYTNCYNGAFTKSIYKVIPQFDECFSNRGGYNESNCYGYYNGVWQNTGYPATSQSKFENPPVYWTSINSPQAQNTALIKSATNNNMVLDVYGWGTADQSQVKLWNWGGQGNENQRWRYETATREIKGWQEKCLDGGNISDSNNRWIRIQSCNGGNNQKWTHDAWGRLHSVADANLCLDSAYGNSTGSFLHLYPCHAGDNQRWNADDLVNMGMPKETFNLYSSKITSNTDNNLIFDVAGMNPSNGTRIILWENYNNNGQKWAYDWNTKQIKGINNKCLDGGQTWRGGNPNDRWLRIYDCHNGGNQKWFMDQDNRIHSYDNENICIDSKNGNSYRSEIYLSQCHQGYNQKWNQTGTGIETRTWYSNRYMFKRVGTNQCFDINSPTNNKSIYTYECNPNGINHRWDWVWTGNNNGSMIRQAETNYCIDAYNPYNGRDAYTYSCNPSTSNHNWYYNGNTRQLIQQNTNYCLDSWNPNSSNGARVYTYQCSDNNINQQWEAIWIN